MADLENQSYQEVIPVWNGLPGEGKSSAQEKRFLLSKHADLHHGQFLDLSEQGSLYGLDPENDMLAWF